MLLRSETRLLIGNGKLKLQYITLFILNQGPSRIQLDCYHHPTSQLDSSWVSAWLICAQLQFSALTSSELGWCPEKVVFWASWQHLIDRYRQIYVFYAPKLAFCLELLFFYSVSKGHEDARSKSNLFWLNRLGRISLFQITKTSVKTNTIEHTIIER